MLNLTPLLLMQGLTLPGGPQARALRTATHAEAEPGWQLAYRQARQPASSADDERRPAPEDDAQPHEPLPTWLMPTLTPPASPAPPPAQAPGRIETASPTAARMAEAAREVATPPVPTSALTQHWQVELPGSAAGWQLQIVQAQPQAPLALELRVPPAQALQAQHQLADLDRRLRDGGHELLRSRIRPGARRSDRRRADDEGTP